MNDTKTTEEKEEETEENVMNEAAAAVSEWVKVVDNDSGASYFVEKIARNPKQGRRR